MVRKRDGLEARGGGKAPDFFGGESLLAWLDTIHTEEPSGAVLTRLAQSLSGALDGAFVAISPFSDHPRTLGLRNHTSAFDPRFEDVFFGFYPDGVPWTALTRERPNEWLHVGDHFDEGTIRATPFYREYMEPQGLLPLEVMGSHHEHGPDLPGFGWAVYGVRPFSAEEIAFCGRLDPHLAVAAKRSAERLSARSALDAARHIADRSPVGLVDIDGRGRVTWTNGAMRHILGLRDGIRLQAGRLETDRAEEQARLDAAIRDLVEGDPEIQAVRVTRSHGHRPLGVLSLPRRGTRELPVGETRGTLVLIDPELPLSPPERLLRELYDLTPAEATLAVAIAAGLKPAQVAAQTGRSVETVRSQLKAVFKKLDVKRQTDVARVVGASGALFPFEGDDPQG